MSSGIEVPTHLALAILVAAGVVPSADIPGGVGREVSVRHQSTGTLPDDRWIELLFTHGHDADVALARRIFRTGSGHIYVPVADDRRDLLALKKNPVLVARVMALAARANSDDLEQLLGRSATMSEVFAAHVLGPKGAAELITAAAANPRQPSIEVLPASALRYPQLFFERTRPRSAAGVLEMLSSAFEKAVQTEIGQRRVAAERRTLAKSASSTRQAGGSIARP